MPTTKKSTKAIAVKKLELYIGGHFGPCYRVSYDKGELVYSVSTHGKADKVEERIRPTSKHWKAFFNACDEIDIHSWGKRYTNPDICEGHNGHLKSSRIVSVSSPLAIRR